MRPVYESPLMRSMRAATRDAIDDADFTERLIDAIDNDPDVRAAILRIVSGAPKPRQTRPTTTQPIRKGRRR